MIKSHPQGIDKNSDDKELESHLQHVFRNEKEIMLSRIHKSVWIEMGRSMGHDGNPRPDIDKYRIQSWIDHPSHHGVPMHVPLVYKENIIHGHQNRNEVVENIVIKREMLITDIIKPVGLNRPRPDNPVIHKRQGPQTGGHNIATIRCI